MTTPTRQDYSNYQDVRPLRFETADYRLFLDPYGPGHSGAIGKIYTWKKLPYDFEAHHKETFIRKITPEIISFGIGSQRVGDVFPIEFVSQDEDSEGPFVIAKIDYSHSRLWDKDKHDGKEVRLDFWRSDELDGDRRYSRR